ncbi:hypothetical protein IEQ34_015650 [Dendrobium chrysotoxum]|uniref:Uncharacterized protein n=1 Tax=Dendrobium chrysotoxum TaxID=161865 RepID=A0AAV7GJ02_DENCH|nr:hypothetical protein IEQ34_015650 [Dendrobium chrysotoxum]
MLVERGLTMRLPVVNFMRRRVGQKALKRAHSTPPILSPLKLSRRQIFFRRASQNFLYLFPTQTSRSNLAGGQIPASKGPNPSSPNTRRWKALQAMVLEDGLNLDKLQAQNIFNHPNPSTI